ncbi:hypothetical protein AVEN_66067-1 [Araneus ventricosus]|uniref:Uncharacterized protein n=1 Tax=Araneus ventricosus TaxID=182803 RepID=A0A4Y2NFE1_ARAVE|nr:hypothetical protein AVEN_66067-1 [Araneus ventricosus]
MNSTIFKYVCEYLKCLSQLRIPPTVKYAVISFLNSQDEKAAEIHLQISELCEENIMSEGVVGKLVRVFKDGRTNMHGDERSGRPSVITEDLVRKLMGKCERTDALRFHLYLMCFLKFQEVLFMEL